MCFFKILKYLYSFFLIVIKVNLNSKKWKRKNKLMHYSHSIGRWHCESCKDTIIKSPRTASSHAKLHGLKLPGSRKKKIPKPKIVKKQVPLESHRISTNYVSPTRSRGPRRTFLEEMEIRCGYRSIHSNSSSAQNLPKLSVLKEKITRASLIAELEQLDVHSKDEMDMIKLENGYFPKAQTKNTNDLESITIAMMVNTDDPQERRELFVRYVNAKQMN